MIAVRNRSKIYAPNLELFNDVEVSAAQILALNATAKVLVPGVVGKFLIFTGATIRKLAGTAYGGIAVGEDLAVKYTSGASSLVLGTCETTGFLDQADEQLRYIRPHTAASGSDSAITPVVGPLVLHLLVGEITTGNCLLKVRTFYRLVESSFGAGL